MIISSQKIGFTMCSIACPFCGKNHQTKMDSNSLLGKKTKCKKCGKSFTIEMNDLTVSASPEPKKEKKSPKKEKTPKAKTDIGFWQGVKNHFGFRDMIFLSWVKGFYCITYIFAILSTASLIATSCYELTGWGTFFAGLFGIWLGVLWLRITCEFGVLFFRIHEELVTISDK